MFALHIQRSGMRTYCGRRMGINDRLTVRGGPYDYVRTCKAMGRRSCLGCSDSFWAEIRRLDAEEYEDTRKIADSFE